MAMRCAGIDREWIWRLALLGAYGILRVTTFGTWEFTGDDGSTLDYALRSTEKLLWAGTPSSVGVPHLPFSYYLYGLLWAAGRSIGFLQAGIVATQLFAHWVMIGTAKRLYSWPYAYAASLLAYFSPVYFSFAGQKFWEPALLPLFSALILLNVLRYARDREFRGLLYAAFAVLLAVSSLQSAIFFAPLLWAAYLIFPPRRPITRLEWGTLALLAGLLGPFAVWIVREHPLRFGAAAVLVGVASKYGRRWAEGEWTGKRAGWILVSVAGLIQVSFYTSAWNPLLGVAHILCAFSSYLRIHCGMAENPPPWFFLPETVPLAAYLAAGLLGFRRLNDEQKVFFLFLLLPLAGLFFAPPRRLFLPHWTLILVPWAWVGVAQGVREITRWLFGARPLAAGFLLAGLLAVQGIRAYPVQRFLRESGGVGMHGPNLGHRLALAGKIAEAPGSSPVYLLASAYESSWRYYYDGWRFIAQNATRPGSGEGAGGEKYFYIYHDIGSAWGRVLLEVARSAPGVEEARFGPVILFSAPRPLVGMEVRVR